MSILRRITHSLPVFSLLTILASRSIAQNTDPSSDWNDTAYHPIILQKNSVAGKVIAYDYGKKAMIYLGYAELRKLCVARINNGWDLKEYQKLLKQLDGIDKADTLRIYEINTQLDYLTSGLFNKGQAKVFDKTNRKFADTVSQRLEKYGSEADRFYYFPDRTAFFAVLQFTGILEKGDQLKAFQPHRSDYEKLYERLREIGK